MCADKIPKWLETGPWHNTWVFTLKGIFTRALGSRAGSFWMLPLLSLLQRTDPNVNLSLQMKQDWEFLLGFFSLFNHVIHVAQGFPFFKPLIFTWTWNRIRSDCLQVPGQCIVGRNVSPGPKYHPHGPLELYLVSLGVSQHRNSLSGSEVYEFLTHYLGIMMLGGELKTIVKFSITTGPACLLRSIILN